MEVVYNNDSEKIGMQLRFMNEETRFERSLDANAQKIDINGHEAIVNANGVDVLIDDVMYMFFGNADVDTDELIKMAESLS